MRLTLALFISIVLLAGMVSAANYLENIQTPESTNNCAACHVETIDVDNNGHFIENNDDCQFCHITNTESTEHQVLIIRNNETCLSCHIKQDAMNAIVSHEELYCVDCHSPHGSDNEFNFKKPTVALCADCHNSHELGNSHPVGGNVVDTRTGQELTCISTCHSLHEPADQKLLQYVNTNDAICSKCHIKY